MAREYELMRNNEGKLVLILSARNDSPCNARLVTDGRSDYAVLYRNRESAVMLEQLTEEAIKEIRGQRTLTVAEVNIDGDVNEYEAEVVVVSRMPR